MNFSVLECTVYPIAKQEADHVAAHDHVTWKSRHEKGEYNAAKKNSLHIVRVGAQNQLFFNVCHHF